jgi:transcriptional regulator with XRE-family HTH domain
VCNQKNTSVQTLASQKFWWQNAWMKKHPRRQSALSKIRAATGLTQRDFAARLGCSAAAVEMAELGERAVSESMAVKVMGLTGCDPDALLLGKAKDQRGKDFTEQSFHSWTAKVQTPELIQAAAGKTAQLVCDLVEDARINGKGCSLPVLIGIIETIDAAVKRFGLRDSLRQRLRDKGQYQRWQAVLLGEEKGEQPLTLGPVVSALLK